MSNKRGRLIVISAPSGAGKGTVICELLKLNPDIAYSVSATTREPRQGEKHGREYYFLSKQEFALMIERGEFLEHEIYVGKHYGTPRKPIEENIANGIDTILELEVKGAREVKRKIPGAIMIFILPPSVDELRRRLYSRGTGEPDELEERMAVGKTEVASTADYDHIVINEDAVQAAKEILGIISSTPKST